MKMMLPLSMSNEAVSLPSWTILPGRVNLQGQKSNLNRNDFHERKTLNLNDEQDKKKNRNKMHLALYCNRVKSFFAFWLQLKVYNGTGQSPEEIGLGVKFEVLSIDVDVKLWCSCVGNTENQCKEVRVLTQLECRGYHAACLKLLSIRGVICKWVIRKIDLFIYLF